MKTVTTTQLGDEIQRTSQRMGRIARFAEDICVVALVALVLLVGTEAIMRNVFDSSLQAVDELGGYLLVAITFVGFAVGEAADTFHRVQLVLAHLSERVRDRLLLFYDYLSLISMLVIFVELMNLLLNSWKSGDVAPTILGTPLWIAQLSMPVGAGLLCASIVRSIAQRHRAMSG